MSDGPGRLRELPIKRLYRRVDRPRDTFYVPCLKVATRYDRFAGYFRAASLEAVADEGLQAFFAHRGRIRIVVDADLTEDDVADVRLGAEVGGDAALREAVIRQVEAACLRAELPGTDRLSLVSTLVAAGLMEVKVAVMRGPDGLPYGPEHPARRVFHDKVGILWDDEEDAVTFRGSLNETPAGWARNYEGFSVYPSWDLVTWDAYGQTLAEEFEQAWSTSLADEWLLFDLPEAVRLDLIKFADPDREWEHHEFDDPGDQVRDPLDEQPDSPPEDDGPVELVPPPDLEALRAEPWSGIRTATVEPWPHQDAAARAVVGALYPPDVEPDFGRMFADEVGLGKTIEIGLVLREALTNRGAKRVLILAPASVAPQWQGEMWDKFSLWMPVLGRGNRLVWPDASETSINGDPWRSSDLLIASSQLARMDQHRRRVADAGWDLLVVDEAHHARRADSSKPGSANLLLKLLRDARQTPSVKRLLLATATPMQMHVHEAWELLNALGMPDIWTVEAFGRYWDELAADRPHDERAWSFLQQLLIATVERWGIDGSVTDTLRERVGFADGNEIEQWHGAAEPGRAARWPRDKTDALVWWLTEQTPLRHLVHRSSRDLLRRYQDSGVIGRDVVIPERDLADVPVHLSDDEERLYKRVETWISKHYQAAKDAKTPAHGFVMTTYRRRLTSSLEAIRVSLERRAEAIAARRDDAQMTLDFASFLDVDDVNVIEDSEDTHFDVSGSDELEGLDDELAELHGFLTDIAQVLETGDGKDTKYRELEDLLRHTILTGKHRTCIVFTQYTDTMRWLRQHLANMLGSEAVATYSGEGGQLPDNQGGWEPATKGEVTVAFRDAATNPDNPLRVLLGTDSMSEGLNLQTCDLLVNYDLPWNFMRLEQRIGRIDRIGGPEIAHVRNLLIVGTVEERVYRGIVDNHGLFGVVIGPTGQVTGDPGVVLTGTEAAITSCVLAGGNVDDALTELREAAGKARARALTSGTFDHSALDDHDPDDGPWSFDRDGLLDRIASALAPRLPEPSSDGYWTVVTDHHGTHRAVLQPAVALANPDLSLLVWGNPAFDAVAQTQEAKPTRRPTEGLRSASPDVMFEVPGSLLDGNP